MARYNPRLAKIHRTYTVEEVALLFNVYKNTVRGWIKKGLVVLDKKRPMLIHGKDLRSYLEHRRNKNKKPCGSGQIYCVRCRLPRFPEGQIAQYKPLSSSQGNLIGQCPECELLIYRRVSMASFNAAVGDLQVIFPKGLEHLAGIGVILGKEDNFLVISDLHIPYHHKDAFDFLYAVYTYYQCTRVLNVGDVIDHHAGSYHESEPDALSPAEEYEQAKMYCQELQQMFPEMIITEGNHDKIPKRKLKSCGLPYDIIHDYNRMYDLDDGWQWMDRYNFDSQGGQPVLVPMVLNKRGRWNGQVHGDKAA